MKDNKTNARRIGSGHVLYQSARGATFVVPIGKLLMSREPPNGARVCHIDAESVTQETFDQVLAILEGRDRAAGKSNFTIIGRFPYDEDVTIRSYEGMTYAAAMTQFLQDMIDDEPRSAADIASRSGAEPGSTYADLLDVHCVLESDAPMYTVVEGQES
jgi:hypothetical protein